MTFQTITTILRMGHVRSMTLQTLCNRSGLPMRRIIVPVRRHQRSSDCASRAQPPEHDYQYDLSHPTLLAAPQHPELPLPNQFQALAKI